MQSPVALEAQNFHSCLCADEMDAPICGPSRNDVAGGPIFHAPNCRVKARRAPSARSVVEVLQDVLFLSPRNRNLWAQSARIAGLGSSKPSRTCCPARLHGTQRSGTHTASCGGARSRRLHSAARRRLARVRAAAADAWRDSRCTSGSSPESSRDRRIPHCS
jgi:hypothetical protein